MAAAAPPAAPESADLGKAARKLAPRSSHADFEPAADRPDPIDVLERQAATRVPELVPIRYGRMAVSPFAFYRGAAAIMAQDLAPTPRSGLTVQCCGDAHLSNFGVFASPERRLVFDLNDFDETLPGPWEWDVKRLAASMLIAAQGNGLSHDEQEQAVLAAAFAYRNNMAAFADMGNLAVWYARLDVEDVLATYSSQLRQREVKGTRKAVAKARTRDSMSAFSKLTETVDGQVRIVDQSPLIVPLDRMEEGVDRHAIFGELARYFALYLDTLPIERRRLVEQFQLADFARKVVGVGSVGTRAWIALLLGHDGTEPLFLQVKEAQASVLEEFLGASSFENHGKRVVVGQRLMQASSDIFLGWVRVDGFDGVSRDFYFRQLKDWKASAEIDRMDGRSLATYGRLCGWTLARAHARTGDRVAIASYLGSSDTFDRALLAFSEAYAEQNERDYQALQAAIQTGRIAAETGL